MEKEMEINEVNSEELNEVVNEVEPEFDEFNNNEEKVRLPLSREKKRLIFYTLLMIYPVIHLSIFYVYANISALAMAFQKYSEGTATQYQIDFVFLDNFQRIIDLFSQAKYQDMIWNSLLLYVLRMGVGMTLALVFSYYIYKKFALTELFRVMLFLPTIISGVVLTLLYEYIVEDVYVALMNNPEIKYGLMTTNKMEVVIFYNLWTGFGMNILMYSGAMSGINESIAESAQLDGVNVLTEFIYITLPMIFPTIITFLVMGISNIFVDQMGLYTFFKDTATFQTVGYFIYVQSLQSNLIPPKTIAEKDILYLSYSEISALGLMITALILPITLTVRHLLEKYGPSDH